MMLAIVAALSFLVALVFDLSDKGVGEWLTSGTLTSLGLVLIALHLGGVGNGWKPLGR